MTERGTEGNENNLRCERVITAKKKKEIYSAFLLNSINIKINVMINHQHILTCKACLVSCDTVEINTMLFVF